MATGDGWEQLDDSFWYDDWIRPLIEQRKYAHVLLFQWCWSGPLRTTSGLFRAPLDAVQSMMGLHMTRPAFRRLVEDATGQPLAGLVWFPQQQYWWVKNYVRHRSDRPNLVAAAVKDLRNHPPNLAALLVEYNRHYGIDLTRQTQFSELSLDATETLLKRFGMCLETYVKGFEQTQTQTQTQESAEAGSSDARPGCDFCRKPTKGPLQHYHDEAKRVLGRCLVIDPAACGAGIAKREKQVGRKKCHALFELFLRSRDPYVLKRGHDLLVFCQRGIFNGLLAEEGCSQSPETEPWNE